MYGKRIINFIVNTGLSKLDFRQCSFLNFCSQIWPQKMHIQSIIQQKLRLCNCKCSAEYIWHSDHAICYRWGLVHWVEDLIYFPHTIMYFCFVCDWSMIICLQLYMKCKICLYKIKVNLMIIMLIMVGLFSNRLCRKEKEKGGGCSLASDGSVCWRFSLSLPCFIFWVKHKEMGLQKK